MTARFPELSDPGRLLRWAADLVRSLDTQSRSQEQTYFRQGAIPIVARYSVADLPSAGKYLGGLIYVSDETGGAVMAFSDGTNWRRVTDCAIVS